MYTTLNTPRREPPLSFSLHPRTETFVSVFIKFSCVFVCQSIQLVICLFVCLSIMSLSICARPSVHVSLSLSLSLSLSSFSVPLLVTQSLSLSLSLSLALSLSLFLRKWSARLAVQRSRVRYHVFKVFCCHSIQTIKADKTPVVIS